jgi:hypothetical protein
VPLESHFLLGRTKNINKGPKATTVYAWLETIQFYWFLREYAKIGLLLKR